MLWRPRSILQLMLFGLMTVVAPLCVAIFYTVETLDEQARQSQSVNQQTISLTRSSQQFQSGLLDLERRARQYVALDDADLLALFVRERQQLLLTLQQMALVLPDDQNANTTMIRASWQLLDATLQQLPELGAEINMALPLFGQLGEESFKFQQLVQNYVDQRLAGLVENANDIQRSLLLMVGLLAVLTFFFSILLIYWINSPVRQIRQQIRQLGSGDMSQPIRVSGPAEMQQLGDQLEWLRTRLDELEQEKLQFLRHMSHELKTPLASLREGADLMAEGVVGELQPKQKDVVDIIQANSHELQRLIENLLDYNQMVHSQALQLQPINLQMLWQELISTYQMTIERNQLQLSCAGGVDEWPVDETKFRAVLDNLLSNAVNYTPQQGVIEVSWYSIEDGSAELLVMDIANNGEPISEQEQMKIFDPFYQGASSRSGPIKGSGIGLSVAKECMQAHGGDLALVEHDSLAVCFRLQCPAESNK